MIPNHGFPLRGFGIALIGHTTLGRTRLDEWSDRPRDLYLTTYNTHNRQTSMPPARFELTSPASERLQTHTLDRAATGIGRYLVPLSSPRSPCSKRYAQFMKNSPIHWTATKPAVTTLLNTSSSNHTPAHKAVSLIFPSLPP